MNTLKEGLAYLGESYWGLPNQKGAKFKVLDKANLYFKWGVQKGELLDFLEAFNGFKSLDLSPEKSSLKFDIYEKILVCLSEILKIRLKKAVESFDFICLQRSKIELRDLNFKKELNEVISLFMDFEERYFVELDNAKLKLIDEDVEDHFKAARKNLLETADLKMAEVEQGIQAFYHRVKAYVEEDQSQEKRDPT